jgi:hypothetical protein
MKYTGWKGDGEDDADLEDKIEAEGWKQHVEDLVGRMGIDRWKSSRNGN